MRYDGDDPYLVVAADKGTATFSDIANEISAEYGFWLGDAFASGGSDGYDHKAMGITARGAWESVRSHAPCARQERRSRRVDRRRHRRHVGRRVRQRDAAVAQPQAGRGLRPPPRLRRPGSRSGEIVRRAQATVRHAQVVVDGLRPRADLCRRRRVRSRRQVDRGDARDARRARHRLRAVDTQRVDQGDPACPGRPALERRHRNICQGVERVAQSGRRPSERRRAHRRRRAALPDGRSRAAISAFTQLGRSRVRARRRPDLHRCDRQLGRASTAAITR